MGEFSDMLNIVKGLENTDVVKTEKIINDERRVRGYMRGLNNFGIYPILSILQDFEKREDYTECAIIMKALERKSEEQKKLIPGIKDKNFPTHIDQFDDKAYRNMFDVFGLTGETAKKNLEHYKKEILRGLPDNKRPK